MRGDVRRERIGQRLGASRGLLADAPLGEWELDGWADVLSPTTVSPVPEADR
jgi:hypothetical protein